MSAAFVDAEAVDGRARLGALLLSVGQRERAHSVINARPSGLEARVSVEELLNHGRVVFDVCPKLYGAARHEQPMEQLERGFTHHSALMVALLPPGIGEEDVGRHQVTLRDETAQQRAGVVVDQPRVLQTLAVEKARHLAHPGAPNLEAEEASVSRLADSISEEVTSAKADLDFDRPL